LGWAVVRKKISGGLRLLSTSNRLEMFVGQFDWAVGGLAEMIGSAIHMCME